MNISPIKSTVIFITTALLVSLVHAEQAASSNKETEKTQKESGTHKKRVLTEDERKKLREQIKQAGSDVYQEHDQTTPKK